MAYEIPGFSFTLKASTGVLSSTSAARQFRFVDVNASGQAVFTAGAAVGVMTNKPTAENQAVTVVNDGIVKVEAAGSTIASGDYVTSDSSGRISATAGTSANTLGRVVEGSSGSTGRILTVLLGAVNQ